MNKLTKLRAKSSLLKIYAVFSRDSHDYLAAKHQCNEKSQQLECARTGDIYEFNKISLPLSHEVYKEAVGNGHSDMAETIKDLAQRELEIIKFRTDSLKKILKH